MKTHILESAMTTTNTVLFRLESSLKARLDRAAEIEYRPAIGWIRHSLEGAIRKAEATAHDRTVSDK